METLVPPLSEDKAIHQELERGPNIQPLPSFEAMSAEFTSPVLLKVGDDVSTDDILPAGSRVLPFRSNIPEISKFLFNFVDDSFYKRALESKNQGSVIVGGWNYGQGSSREHAAIAPRFLGVKAVIAKSFARIHNQNLINWGVLPLHFQNAEDFEKICTNDTIQVLDIHQHLDGGSPNLNAKIISQSGCETIIRLQTDLSEQHRQVIRYGGYINWLKTRLNH